MVSEHQDEIQLGAQGRLVIPSHLRKALDLKTGERLILRRVGDSLVLERPATVSRRLRARFEHIPAEDSLVEELLAERREEVRRETR